MKAEIELGFAALEAEAFYHEASEAVSLGKTGDSSVRSSYLCVIRFQTAPMYADGDDVDGDAVPLQQLCQCEEDDIDAIVK